MRQFLFSLLLIIAFAVQVSGKVVGDFKPETQQIVVDVGKDVGGDLPYNIIRRNHAPDYSALGYSKRCIC